MTYIDSLHAVSKLTVMGIVHCTTSSFAISDMQWSRSESECGFG